MYGRITARAIFGCLILMMSACGDGEPIATASDTRWLTSTLETERNEKGWPMPAGWWATQSFGDPLVFRTDAELVLLAEEEDILVVGLEGSNNQIVVSRTTGIWNGSADVPVPADTEGMTEALAANGANTVVDEGVVDASIPWWNLIVEEMPNFTYPCELGPECAIASLAGNDRVSTLQGEAIRMYARNDLLLGLQIHALGDPTGLADTIEAAELIATSLAAAPDGLAEAPPVRFIDTALGESTEPGEWRARLGASTFELTLEEPLDLTPFASDLTTTGFESDAVQLYIFSPTYLDPEQETPRQDGPPDDPVLYLSKGAETAAEFEDYLQEFVSIEASGNDQVFGQDAAWWDLGDPLPEKTVPCPDSSDNLCLAFIGSFAFLLPISDVPDEAGRLYFIEERKLAVLVGAVGVSLDEAFAQLEPVLTGGRITG